jgi:uncharacterized paraquat-inducible protein A
MKNPQDKRRTALVVLLVSLLFFGLGFLFPLFGTGYGLGPIRIYQENVYLFTSFSYFFNKGEVFIGALLLTFTVIFPAIKYIFLFVTLGGIRFPKHRYISIALEIVNKWAMLDVFVVALIILNLKFDSNIIVTRLDNGTNLFAISVILLMTASFLTGKWSAAIKPG